MYTVHRIKDMRSDDRPRERLERQGPQALSNPELLAILLGTGTPGLNAVQLAQELLDVFGGLPGLHRADYDDLVKTRGIGPAKAAQLGAAVELGRRLAVSLPGERPAIQSPEQAAELVMYEMGALNQEHLRVLLLDTRNHLIRITEVYQGSLDSSLIRVGELFRDAVRANAASVIVVHNHPSGNPSPSPEDVAITREMVNAGRLLDIEVLDHLVIGAGRFISLKSKGLGFDSNSSVSAL
ncbi:MAG: DNA repair protein RadC [Chloroflexi bacterium]|nr:DNA repair protein RadC [Chloroflexota bacterium]MDK1044281.1 DNA repair protein RadC [Anaerolineales bacterium]MCH8340014.1 DNA repair protein RadC [Chloroflexota bacterium]MCH8875362.1 DNA repair protein RadC [Chloroflexota bacterium]MCI0772609.1 DNA repair protein RadC [Chloroflexota bacterium]